MSVDDQRLDELIVESKDLQADAIRANRSTVADLREIGRSRRGRPVDLDAVRRYRDGRRTVLRRGGFGLGALAARGLVGTAFGAADHLDRRPTGLGPGGRRHPDPPDGGVAREPRRRHLRRRPRAARSSATTPSWWPSPRRPWMQHGEHGAAFNAQAEALGGQRQDATNPKYTPIVEDATPGLTDYAAGRRAGRDARGGRPGHLPGQPLPAQRHRHEAALRHRHGRRDPAPGDPPGRRRPPGRRARSSSPSPPTSPPCPAAAGSVAFPEAFEEPDLASPPEEGAVQ